MENNDAANILIELAGVRTYLATIKATLGSIKLRLNLLLIVCVLVGLLIIGTL